MENILDRFLRYVAVDTQSDPESETQPSAAKELDLLRMLCKELQEMGVEATIDEYGYVMGHIPSNCGREDVPAIGFIAHADTAPDASGADIKPQIIKDYDGSDIDLKGVPGLALRVAEFPEMALYKGQTLITTDGTTLLGADDKAGIAEIMDAVQYIMNHPEFKHGDIKIGFTPDEEIGRGVVKFDVAKFGAKYAYTMDGGQIGELEYENFNAAGATVRIQGRNVHPGTAKGKMKNAILIGMELNSLLPVEQRPEYTEGYEGFFHLISFKGEVESATFSYIYPNILFDSTSGWYRVADTDMDSYHWYFKNLDKLQKVDHPIFLSEFGALCYKVKDHAYGSDEVFGYTYFPTIPDTEQAFVDLYEQKIIPYKDKLIGTIYTQLSDVEEEDNGLLTYDRKVLKFNKETIQRVLKKLNN